MQVLETELRSSTIILPSLNCQTSSPDPEKCKFQIHQNAHSYAETFRGNSPLGCPWLHLGIHCHCPKQICLCLSLSPLLPLHPTLSPLVFKCILNFFLNKFQLSFELSILSLFPLTKSSILTSVEGRALRRSHRRSQNRALSSSSCGCCPIR